jgi:hypothetical protein
MRRVKRMAIQVRPKAPYINWANGLEEGGVKLGSEYLPEGNIYLIEDSDDLALNLEALLDRHYAAIFEEELGEWHRVDADWPQRRGTQPGVRPGRRLAAHRALRPLLDLRPPGADSRDASHTAQVG